MGSVLGGHNKSSQTQTSSGQGTSQSQQASKSSSTGISNSDASSFSKAGLSANDVLTAYHGGMQSTDQWSKASAMSDVQGALRAQANDALQSVMPSIAKTEIGAGAYNSTTRDLLQNDANARITAQLSKTALDAITQYGQLGNQTTANNTALLGALGGVAKDTGSSGSTSTSSSTQISDSASMGQSTSQYDQNSSGSGSSKGGSGLLGLFADGGEVDEEQIDPMQMFLDATGINKSIMDFKDIVGAGKKALDGDIGGAAKDAAKVAGKQEEADLKLLSQGAKVLAGFFANGGQVGTNHPLMHERLLQRADGGPVPEDTLTPAEELLAAVRKYNNGGKVRTGESDVQAGGKIRGPQSPTGQDNQVIGVAGGEGIIPKDVMEVPGVSQFLEHLIKNYHTPVKQ